MLTTLLLFSVAFLIGSIPTGYIAGRLFSGTDIRLHGSGNTGATNAFRVLGKKIGMLVFAVDFFKGFLPAFLVSRFFSLNYSDPKELGLWIGVGAILGHVFTPFLGFKGGKGIATGAGVLCGAFPILCLMVIGVWGIVFFFTRIVSISSLIALIALVIFSFFLGLKLSISLLFLGVCLFTIWTHRSNISRLRKGEERKVN